MQPLNNKVKFGFQDTCPKVQILLSFLIWRRLLGSRVMEEKEGILASKLIWQIRQKENQE